MIFIVILESRQHGFVNSNAFMVQSNDMPRNFHRNNLMFENLMNISINPAVCLI